MWSLGFCLVTLYTKSWQVLLCLTSSKVPFPKSWPLRVFWLRVCWNYLAGHGFQSVVLFEGICLQDWQQWKHYFQWLKVKDWDLLVHLELANLQPYGAFSDLCFFSVFFFGGFGFAIFVGIWKVLEIYIYINVIYTCIVVDKYLEHVLEKFPRYHIFEVSTLRTLYLEHLWFMISGKFFQNMF